MKDQNKGKEAFFTARALPSRSRDLSQLRQNGWMGSGRSQRPPCRSGLRVDARVPSLGCPILRPGTDQYMFDSIRLWKSIASDRSDKV